MAENPVILYVWDGESMVPAKGFAKRCDERFVVGEQYCMEVEEYRSWVSHKHQFAWLREAWSSLPDHLMDQFATPDHLRKFALIKTGHHTLTQHGCKSGAEAQRLAAAVRPMDQYAVVVCEGTVVSVYQAMSQSVRAMGKAQFQQSKTDILDYVASLLHVEPAVLVKQGKAA